MSAWGRLGALAAAVVMMACAAARAADVVVLRTGSMYEGTVIRFDASDLEMAVDGGRVLLRRSQIASIHFETTAAEVRRLLDGVRPGGPAAPMPADERALGAWHKNDRIEIRIKSAEIKRVWYRDLFRLRQRSDAELLVLTFEVVNPHDTKNLKYRDNELTGSSFVMVDDRGDASRAGNFGLGTHIEGALKPDDDIGPKKTVTHVVVFEKPRRSTDFVTVTVRLSGFGASGDAKFRVKAEEMGLRSWP